MRYLLDTHAILWYIDAAQELPLALRDLMDGSECFYSVASLWEIAIKQSLGRLNRDITVSEYDSLCRQAGFRHLPILPSHLERIKICRTSIAIHSTGFLLHRPKRNNLSLSHTTGSFRNIPLRRSGGHDKTSRLINCNERNESHKTVKRS